ncbi:hypothetical protein EG329_010141 [Mollisiaceae sp. DMI_Dod_QoI]|nr:hypothetical protein EG329_010141 [Helotiales sp. DMI_Dod_QoI]
MALLLASSTFAAPSFAEIAARNTSSSLTTEGTSAYYCWADTNYCGWDLIDNFQDDYKGRISAKLCQLFGDCDPNSSDIWNSLWVCGNDLEFIAICGGAYSCVGGGSGHSDYCRS